MDPEEFPHSSKFTGTDDSTAVSTVSHSISTTLVSPRKRRDRQEDSGESADSMVDSDEPLRQGYPRPLLPLPLGVQCVAPDTEERINWPRTREIVHRILKTHGFKEYSVSVLNRLPPSRLERLEQSSGPVTQNENLTCFIVAKRDIHSNSWYLALKDFEEQFRLQNIGGFTIEIIDPEMCKPELVHPVEPDQRIVSLWPDMRMDILKKLSGLHWSTLSVVRFGRSLLASENPVTILIGAPKQSDETWKSLTTSIRKIVDRFFLDEVKVVIIPAKHPFSSLDDPKEKLLPLSAFQSDVEMGSSFGPKDVETAATVGGTIRLRHSNGNSHHALMSVFHCFRTVVGHGTFKLCLVNSG
jgi:hypothetical protein